MNRKILLSYSETMKPTPAKLCRRIGKNLRSYLLTICEKRASNSPVGLYSHRKVKIAQFYESKYSNSAEIYV